MPAIPANFRPVSDVEEGKVLFGEPGSDIKTVVSEDFGIALGVSLVEDVLFAF